MQYKQKLISKEILNRQHAFVSNYINLFLKPAGDKMICFLK